ncbi:MAG: DUF1080 domain-containing protein [Verrucomicrobiales bacterium]|nr:DUF1080 domain-containing protein [Verrucomicrobiales bacterium]
MNRFSFAPILLFTALITALAISPASTEDFRSLFDGKSLAEWNGADGFWSVSKGTIVGQTTADNPTKGNTFLVWQGGDVSDFEFTCEVKFEGNNSGVQYRSEPVDDAGVVLKGYQADLHPKPEYFGMMYGEKLGKRGIIATRHQRVEYAKDESKKVVAEAAPSTTLTSTEWNTLRIVAVGNRLVHLVNNVVTVDITDNHPLALASGKLGLQLHAGPPMKVEFRNLQYRALTGDDAKKTLMDAAAKFPKASPIAAANAPRPNLAYQWISETPKPNWIWRADKTDNEPIFLRHTFDVTGKIKAAKLYSTCDNGATLWVNGEKAGVAKDWGDPVMWLDAKKFFRTGKNTIAVEAHNRGGAAAFVFKLELETEDGKKQHVISTPDWKLSLKSSPGWEKAGFDDSQWNAKLKPLGAFGVQPWGIAGQNGPGGNSKSARKTPADVKELTIAKDFSADLLYTVPKDEQGSWVSLCSEPGGGFYASDQGDKGLFHITVSEGAVEVTPTGLTAPDSDKLLSGAQGLVWAFDSLWFHRNGGQLYRITDSNGDGKLDKVAPQPSSASGGEHGNHAVLLDETGEQLYLVGGNHAAIPPEEATARRRVQSWDEDHLLPRMWDARGHARGRLAPGGWISRYDPKSKTHDLISIGFRNEYDATLNSAGDLFAYDADMEWDMGSYWYRPTRINFVASGSDHGWRSGTGKWPTYYEDSLPPVVEIGPGSPTGFLSGTEAKFPEKYQRALFALDWTFGTIWAIHPEQKGAGYVGTKEVFVAGVPLPVTDGVIGEDGNLYFLVGGRGTQSAMYRVQYTGSESTAKAPALAPTGERQIARALEAYHGVENQKAVKEAWPHLSSEDVFLRHAARVAIESQPVDSWDTQALLEKDPQALIAAAVALARSGDKSHQSKLIDALLGVDFASLTEHQKLGLLRAYALTFIRLGSPTEEQRLAVIEKLDPFLPADSPDLNTELIRVLVYLHSPTVVKKATALITGRGGPEIPDWAEIAARNASYGGKVKSFLDNHPPSREVYYAMMLAYVRKGWTLKDRRICIELLNQAAKGEGGASFPGFLANIRDLHLGAMTNKDRLALAEISGENFNPVPDFEIQPIVGPGQPYTLESAKKSMNFRKADFEKGRSLFHATSCGACHRLDGLGGDIGPDLTTIPNKFDTNYVLEAIINPSKDISDQYSMFEVTLKDGTVTTGLYVENGDRVSIYPPDHTADPTEVSKSDVKGVKQLPISQMPPGLINMINPEELRDLMAYLMSGGDKESKVYRK